MVHLDHLDGVEMRSGDVGEVHHQDRAHREVRGDNPAHSLALAGRFELVDGVGAQTGRSNHR